VIYKLTREQQAQTLANYLPGGKAFAGKNISSSQTRRLLRGLADELMRTDEVIDLLRWETLPDTTEFFIDEWESAVGIPCECFKGTGDDTERRLHVIIKLAWMAVQTGGDFIALANALGVTCYVEGGSIHGAFPFVFPIRFYPSAKAAFHTIVVTFVLPEELVFTYEFPIEFSTGLLTLVQCIFNKIKPAHVDIIYDNL
jgi:uncharacterized protein YmfQ (DUF2313 family)